MRRITRFHCNTCASRRVASVWNTTPIEIDTPSPGTTRSRTVEVMCGLVAGK
jgi:hypothetical protein